MSDSSGSTPAGWFPDPSGAPRQRYWDGAAWTQHFHPPLTEEPAAAVAPKVRKSHKKLWIGLLSGALVLALGITSFVVFAIPAMQAGFNGRTYSDPKWDYDYTDGMESLDADHEFEFAIDFDLEDRSWELDPDAEIAPSTDWAFEMFIDPAFTKHAAAMVLQYTGDDAVTIGPQETNTGWTAADHDEVEIAEEFSQWGLHTDYYLMRKIDSTGKTLDKPVVTHFTIAGELAAPVVTFGTPANDGNLSFSWPKVEGASEYIVIASSHADFGGRDVTVLGETTKTTWSSADNVEDFSDETPWVDVQNNEMNMFWLDSADDVANGFGDGENHYSEYDFGVIAKNDTEYSPYNTYDALEVGATLPYETAFLASRDLKRWGASGFIDGIENVQKTIAFTSLDGATRSTIAYIDPEKVVDYKNRWVLPLMGRGTQLGEWVPLSKSSEPDIAAAVKKFNADAEASAPTTGMPTFEVVAAPVDEFAKGLKDAPATDYPIFGSNDLTKFIAAHMIAQTPVVDLSDYVGKPNLPEVTDAGFEAMYQNPYVMNVDGLSLNRDGTKLYISYTHSLDETKALQKGVAAKVKSVVASVVKTGMSDAKKVTALNNWLTGNATYDYEAFNLSKKNAFPGLPSGYENAWNSAGVLTDGTGVCASYAYAFNALSNAAGVETVVIVGDVLAGGGHAWNKVKIDGKWKAVDPTWNDSPDANRYLLIPDSGFSGSAKRVEDAYWMSDLYLGDYATS